MTKGAVIEPIVAIAVVITSTVIVINMLGPTLDEGRTFQNLNKGKELMSVLDTVMRQLAVEAPGSRRSLNLISDFGTFSVSGAEDAVRFTLEDSELGLEPGSVIREGNLIITSGPTMRAYEADIDGDGSVELVLENDAVLVAMRKIGSEGSFADLNTTSMFTMIRNKRANVTITPITRIYIDDRYAEGEGTGFTQLTAQGSSLLSAGILVHVSAATKEYDAIFTLSSAQDFLELEVKNIRDK